MYRVQLRQQQGVQILKSWIPGFNVTDLVKLQYFMIEITKIELRSLFNPLWPGR